DAFLINKYLKKASVTMLAVPLAAVYIGGTGVNEASAEESSTEVGYNCTGEAAGLIDVDLDMDVDIHSDVPDSLKPGEDFSVEDSYTDIELELDDTVKETANPLEGEVTQFDLEFDNAVESDSEESTVNVEAEGMGLGRID